MALAERSKRRWLNRARWGNRAITTLASGENGSVWTLAQVESWEVAFAFHLSSDFVMLSSALLTRVLQAYGGSQISDDRWANIRRAYHWTGE